MFTLNTHIFPSQDNKDCSHLTHISSHHRTTMFTLNTHIFPSQDNNVHAEHTYLPITGHQCLTLAVVEDDASEVVETKGAVDGGLWLEVVLVGAVVLVQLVQHGLVCALHTHTHTHKHTHTHTHTCTHTHTHICTNTHTHTYAHTHKHTHTQTHTHTHTQSFRL